MMSQPKLVTAGQVEKYHKNKNIHDYYSQNGNGEWFGNTANSLNLKGNIDQKDFDNIVKENERFRTFEFKISFNKDLSRILKDEVLLNKFQNNIQNFIYDHIKNNDNLNSKYTDKYNNTLKIVSLSKNINSNFSKKTNKLYLSFLTNKVHPSNWETIYKELKNDNFYKLLSNNINEFFNNENIKPKKNSFSLNLVTNRGRVGIDIVSIVPKSCSIAMWLNKDIRHDVIESNNTSNKYVLDYIEKNLIQARIYKNKIQTPINTNNMICASYSHFTNRHNDPFYHIHNIIFNETYDNNKLKALHNDLIYKNQTFLKHLHSNMFYKLMSKKGYKFIFTNKEKNEYELEFIPLHMNEYYSKSARELNKNISKYNLDKKSKGLIDNILKKIKPKKKNIPLKDLIPQWLNEYKKNFNITPRSYIKYTNSLQSNSSSYNKNYTLHNLFFDKLQKRLNNKFFFFSELEYLEFCLNQGTEIFLDINDIQTTLNNNINDGNFIKVTIDNNVYLMTKRTFDVQLKIFSDIDSGIDKSFSFKDNDINLFIKNYIDFKKITNLNFDIKDEQKNFIKFLLKNKDQFCAIQGLPGVGKTFTLDIIQDFLEHENIKVTGLSFLGKAVSTLKNAGITNSHTIHSFLNSLEKEASYNRNEEIINSNFSNISEKIDFNFDGLVPLEKHEIWLIDESSMTDNNLLFNIQKAAIKRNAKVVYIGDKHQHNPIGPGYSFFYMINNNKINYINLTDIQRQNLASLDIQNVVKLSAIDNPSENTILNFNKTLDNLKSSGNIKTINNDSSRHISIAKQFSDFNKNDILNSAVITSLNKDKDNINDLIREQLKKKNYISKKEYSFNIKSFNSNIPIIDEIKSDLLNKTLPEDLLYKTSIKKFSVNDKIMFLKNDNNLGVNNGTIGIIKSISKDHIQIKLLDDYNNSVITLNTFKYNYFTHGYCFTSHKAQSQTIKNIIYDYNSKLEILNNKNSWFVNISRTQKELYIFTDSFSKMKEQIHNPVYTPNIDQIDKSTDKESYILNKLDSYNKNVINKLNLSNKLLSKYFDLNDPKLLNSSISSYVQTLNLLQKELYNNKNNPDFIEAELKEFCELFIDKSIADEVLNKFNSEFNVNKNDISLDTLLNSQTNNIDPSITQSKNHAISL